MPARSDGNQKNCPSSRHYIEFSELTSTNASTTMPVTDAPLKMQDLTQGAVADDLHLSCRFADKSSSIII